MHEPDALAQGSVSFCMNVSLVRAAVSHPAEAPQALLARPWSPSMGSSQPRDMQTAWNVNSKTQPDMYRLQEKQKKILFLLMMPKREG